MERETKTYTVMYLNYGIQFRYPHIYRSRSAATKRAKKLRIKHGSKAFVRVIEKTVTEKVVEVL
jgi:hypothetical protein